MATRHKLATSRSRNYLSLVPPVPAISAQTAFQLDVDNEKLHHGAETIALPPKTFAVLRYLHDHVGRLVTKQALLDAVWPDTIVTEAVLKNCILKLRTALGDDARSPRYIETVHGRGYRFLTPLPTTAPTAESQTSEVQSRESGATSQESESSVQRPASSVQRLEPEAPRGIAPGQPLVPGLSDARPQTLDAQRKNGERRQLTVMFCDLVDSTALSAQLDPEDYRELIGTYTQICSEVVTRYEGYIAQYLGGGLLVYFGHPQAHEDDAARSIRAGLEIVSALDQARDQFIQPVQVRIGIHTGLVVVGQMGGGSRHEQLALGETPNIAAGVQGQAAPDTVVISTATYRLVQGLFECQDLGPHERKGISVAQSLYQVQGESEAQSRFDVAVQSGLTPLVGRSQELGLLGARWEQAKSV